MLDYYYVIIFILIFLKVIFWSFYFYVRSRRLQAIRALQAQQAQNPHRIIIVATQRRTPGSQDRMPIIPNEELPVPVTQPPSYDQALADPSSKPPDYQQAMQGHAAPYFPQHQGREATPGQGQTTGFPPQQPGYGEGTQDPWSPQPPPPSSYAATAPPPPSGSEDFGFNPSNFPGSQRV